MPSQVTNYQCPSCKAPLHFAGSSGKLECDYCGSVFDVAEIEALYAEQNKAAAEAKIQEDQKAAQQAQQGAEDPSKQASQKWGAEADDMKVYQCPSCGAELFCDATTSATSCPYCGNPTVVPGQFEGGLRPDFVLPFKLDKKAAIQALQGHYKGKLLLPKAFTDQNHIEEIKGVYVPFWLFDTQADVDAAFAATRIHTYKQGEYRITDTKHYQVHRAGSVNFSRVPVDGSSKMPDDYMDSIEPFDYSEIKPFSVAYLPGFLADKYDVDAAEAAKRMESRCANSAVSSMRNTVVGYDTVIPELKHVDVWQRSVKYALMPVWMLSTRWNDKNYLFAMNGQTGRFVGDLPMDKSKLLTWFLGLAVSLSVLFSLLFSGPIGRWIAGMIG